ncbi:hypothetical protein DL770_001283 [Monosporascus sp. CRB-9-2]|nr:hypothetical protein DL770_001283 [Monosporascus sp. CRB-9-2]
MRVLQFAGTNTPLATAACWKQEMVAEYLIERGADVNLDGESCQTSIFWDDSKIYYPLHWALALGSTHDRAEVQSESALCQTISALLDNGADLDIPASRPTQWHFSPKNAVPAGVPPRLSRPHGTFYGHGSICSEDQTKIHFLVARRAWKTPTQTCSPFHTYVANTATEVQINLFEIFVAYPIEINAPDYQDRTLLGVAVAHLDHCRGPERRAGRLVLIPAPSSSQYSFARLAFPLCIPITQNNPMPRNSDSVRFLLTRSTRANVRDAGGVTPLHVARRYKDIGVANNVLKSVDPPADVDAVDALRRVQLHYACGATERCRTAAPRVDTEVEMDTTGPWHRSRRRRTIGPHEGDHGADRIRGVAWSSLSCL